MASQPHILLITADELRKDALGAYGCEAVRTPDLDRLAAGGTRFEAAYTPSPLCLPARCSLLTGLYPHRSEAYSNFRECVLSPERPNLYNQLRAAGYTTAHVGKCHYTPVSYGKIRPDVTQEMPGNKEFCLSLGLDSLDLQDGKHGSVWFWDDYSRELDAAGYLAAYRDLCASRHDAKVFTFPGPAKWHPDAWVGRKAVERIERCRADRPTFTWVSFSGPHYPMDPPAEYLDRVDESKVGIGWRSEGEWDDRARIQASAWYGEGPGLPAEGVHWAKGLGLAGCKDLPDEFWRKARRHYFANVALIDDWVGRVLEAAEAQFGPRLLVIFTADHGDMLGNHGLIAKNGCGFEDVLNVPLLLRGAGFGPAVTGCRVSLLDLMPTCLAAAGLEPSAPVDGLDLRERLEGGGLELIFSEAECFLTVQDRRHKYIHTRAEGRTRCELYDLAADPHEVRNLAACAEYAPVLAELRGALTDHLMGTVLA